MTKLWSITVNTFTQTIRQPIFGVLLGAMLVMLVLSLPFAAWTLGTGQGDFQVSDQKMLVMMSLGTLLLASLLQAVFGASAALSREIDDRTALTVISKPVPRSTFVLGKFLGVAGAVMLAYYIGSLVFLMTVRHKVLSSATDPYDMPVIVLGFGAGVLALAIAIVGNIHLNWPFISSAVWSLVVTLTIAMIAVLFIGKDWKLVSPGYDQPPKPAYTMFVAKLKAGQPLGETRKAAETAGFGIRSVNVQKNEIVVYNSRFGGSVLMDLVRALPGVEDVATDDTEPRVITGQHLIALGLMVMASLVVVALAVATSTHLGQIPTLLLCLGLVMLWSDHEKVFDVWTKNIALMRVLGFVTPNLSFFYAIDAIARESEVSGAYLLQAVGYGVLAIAAILAVGVGLFQQRALEARTGGGLMPGVVNVLAGLGRLLAVALALTGLEGLLSLLMRGGLPQLVLGWWGWLPYPIFTTDTSFVPVVYNTLGSLFSASGQPSIWMGLMAALALPVAAVGLWQVSGLFARGVRWTYWAAFGLSVLTVAWLALAVADRAVMPALPRHLRPGGSLPALVLEAIVAVAVMLLLVASSTRRHFRKPARYSPGSTGE